MSRASIQARVPPELASAATFPCRRREISARAAAATTFPRINCPGACVRARRRMNTYNCARKYDRPARAHRYQLLTSFRVARRHAPVHTCLSYVQLHIYAGSCLHDTTTKCIRPSHGMAAFDNLIYTPYQAPCERRRAWLIV